MPTDTCFQTWRRRHLSKLGDERFRLDEGSAPARFAGDVIIVGRLRSDAGALYDVLTVRRVSTLPGTGPAALAAIQRYHLAYLIAVGAVRLRLKVRMDPAEVWATHSPHIERLRKREFARISTAAATSGKARAAARRRHEICTMLEGCRVPNSAAANGQALTKLWTAAMAARFGAPPAASTVVKWRAMFKRSDGRLSHALPRRGGAA